MAGRGQVFQMLKVKTHDGRSPTVGVPLKIPGAMWDGDVLHVPQEPAATSSTHRTPLSWRGATRTASEEGLISHAQQRVPRRAEPRAAPKAAPSFRKFIAQAQHAKPFAPFARWNIAMPAAQVMNVITIPGAAASPSWGGLHLAGPPQVVGMNHLPADTPQRLGVGGGEFKAFGTAMNVWSGNKNSQSSAISMPGKGFRSQGAPMMIGNRVGSVSSASG